jgi:chromosomal replication initiation ATPase DnaA
MNFENVGTPIAELRFEGDKSKTKKISVEPDRSNVSEYLETISTRKPKEHIQHIPNKKTERSILYITGASGSGKSYYTRNYCNEYKKIFPKNEIYLLSSVQEDSSIDKVKDLKRINLDNNFLGADLNINDFKNCMLIFDDTDVITNKMMKMKVNNILNLVLETGRHTNTSVIYTSHLPTNGLETRRILNECHSVTIFPHSLGGRSLKYLLENYFGLDKDQIKKVKKLQSRWVTICKTYPMVVMADKDIYVVTTSDD